MLAVKYSTTLYTTVYYRLVLIQGLGLVVLWKENWQQLVLVERRFFNASAGKVTGFSGGEVFRGKHILQAHTIKFFITPRQPELMAELTTRSSIPDTLVRSSRSPKWLQFKIYQNCSSVLRSTIYQLILTEQDKSYHISSFIPDTLDFQWEDGGRECTCHELRDSEQMKFLSKANIERYYRKNKTVIASLSKNHCPRIPNIRLWFHLLHVFAINRDI